MADLVVATCCAFAGLSLDVSGLGARPKPEFARFFALEFPGWSAVDQPRLIRNQQVAGSTPAGGFFFRVTNQGVQRLLQQRPFVLLLRCQ